MTLVRFNKGHRGDLARLHGEMDDLFDGFFRGLDRPFAGYKVWPAIDVAEEEDSIIVRAEVPGCKADDIDISVHGNVLTISGEKKLSEEKKEKGYYHVESSYGSFRREVTLPTDVNQSKVDASYKDGVLSIVLPKAEKAKTIKVKIKA
ncbi:MAG: Hsp20/alpha crystallin family protein [Planctomycetes bacterium]|nr:Hsp20/alpha crystallin family protein [Planctomycetota bacterium]MBL7146318.1 Hsp20/alpha crystallin family protein [Phycisphaerae bacterium]